MIYDAYVRAWAWLKVILPESAFLKPEPQVKLYINNGGMILGSRSEIKRIKEERKTIPKEPKKPTAVDRYLQYLDWEAKQKIKYRLIVPMILQYFSHFDGLHDFSFISFLRVRASSYASDACDLNRNERIRSCTWFQPWRQTLCSCDLAPPEPKTG